MATFTNRTAKQPLAIGSLGLLIEPGQSVTVTVANMHRAAESPVVQAWVKSGMLEVSPENGDDAAGARAHLDAAIAAYRTRGAGERQRSAALLRASVDVGEGVVPPGLGRLLHPWLEVTRPVTPDERLAGRVSAEAHLLRGEVDQAEYAVARLAGNAHQGFAAEMHERLLVAKVAAAQGDRERARRTARSHSSRPGAAS